MKIGVTGFDHLLGKHKYKDDRLSSLAAKLSPQKTTPFFVEFCQDDLVACDALLVLKERLWDVFILDMERLEARLSRTNSDQEIALMKKCLGSLEKEIPLCDSEFTPEELIILRGIAPLTLKPVCISLQDNDVNGLITEVIKKSKIVFFYTAGKKEVRAWPVAQGTDIVSCAAKIHTDLARGFIKADIVSYSDFLNCHNMNEARNKGLVNIVDRSYAIQDGDIIEIRFNV